METLQKQKIDGYDVGVRTNDYDASKKTIILIHGIGVSSVYYIPLATELAGDYNVFALDLPGYGATQKPSKPLNIEQLANVTASFIWENNLQNVIVVGHSMGCQIIARLNQLESKNIQKLILLSPTTNRRERSVLMQAVRLTQDTFHETLEVNIIIFSNYLRMGVVRYLQTSKYMVTNHLEDSLQNITTPTLIVRGEKDPIVPRDWTTYLQTLSPTIETTEIPSVPHAFHYSFAKETKQLCQTFIEK
ncbi:MAG: hypothetical protein JWO54_806 [Candidatus Saccharibacteria bacterium]|nr:hypothetical protein [Candidatus Saccharibacteria bacterium]MDB5181043.1 hypothetical protein [Candidatus Saccharibacteria bacterium]